MKKTIKILTTIPFLHLSLEAADHEIDQMTPLSMHTDAADPMKKLLETKVFAIDATKPYVKAMCAATTGFSEIRIAEFADALNRNERKFFASMTSGWEIANVIVALSTFSGAQIDTIASELQNFMTTNQKLEMIKAYKAGC